MPPLPENLSNCCGAKIVEQWHENSDASDLICSKCQKVCRPAPPKASTEKWKKGKRIYVQGNWECEVVQDLGDTVKYIALEGLPPMDVGKVLTAAKDLFTEARENHKYDPKINGPFTEQPTPPKNSPTAVEATQQINARNGVFKPTATEPKEWEKELGVLMDNLRRNPSNGSRHEQAIIDYVAQIELSARKKGFEECNLIAIQQIIKAQQTTRESLIREIEEVFKNIKRFEGKKGFDMWQAALDTAEMDIMEALNNPTK